MTQGAREVPRTLYVTGPERLSYQAAFEAQQRSVGRCLASERTDNFLMLLEHPPVITIGRTGGADEVVAESGELRERGVEVVETNRGGRVTFHGPGQLVMYPIVDLKERGADLHRYLRDLEGWLTGVLAEFGIEAGVNPPHTGVWVGEKKIASIGIAVRHWIAYHGVALNVATDLARFGLIVPCGLRADVMTSMEALTGGKVEISEVAAKAARAFAEAFEFDSVVECEHVEGPSAG